MGYTGGVEGDYWGICGGYADGFGVNAGGRRARSVAPYLPRQNQNENCCTHTADY